MQININIRDGATPLLTRFLGGLRRKRGLHRMMGNRVQAVTRDHLIAIANSRHATARRLGATPSGHWGKAAEKVARPGALKTSEEAAVLVINHPGITRAFRDITIVPTGGRTWLTIPLIAQAYNRRAYRVPGLFRPLRKGAKATGHRFTASGRRVATFDSASRMRVLSRSGRGGIVHWYALVKSVIQRADRSLLPSDAEYTSAAQAGVLDYIRLLRSKAGGVA